MQDKLCFTTASFDRKALKRTDQDWLAQQLDDPSSIFILYKQGKFLVSDDLEILYLEKNTAESYTDKKVEWIYLGDSESLQSNLSERVSIFGAEISNTSSIESTLNWQSLRNIGLSSEPETANMLVYAQGLFNWHNKNNFCGSCGSILFHHQAGHTLLCSNNDCAHELFPRTDPAVIVLIYHEDACLLGRSASWPEHSYSCIAGFVETGEDLNAAVRRETYEETGLLLNEIEFRGSQPWPFPQSLMLGFHAKAKHRDLTFHDGEIQQAQWLTRQELLTQIEKGKLKLSSPLSISYHLIEDWFNQKSDIPLSEIMKQF